MSERHKKQKNQNVALIQDEPIVMEGTGEMINCKACGSEVMKTKIVMHLSRNEDCKKEYGDEFNVLKAEKAKAKKEYMKLKRKQQYAKEVELKAKVHKRFLDSDEDSDALDEDEEVERFHDVRESKQLSNAKYYNKNSDKLKKKLSKYYTDNADKFNKKKRLDYDPNKRKKAYDPKKQKESYDPEKRKAAYQKEIENEREGISKETRVLRQDRTKQRQSCMRLEIVHSGNEIHGNFKRSCLPLGNGVKGVFKYIDGVQNMSLQREVINTMTKVFTNFLNLYKEIEKDIKKIEKEAVGLKNVAEIRKLFWRKLFKWDNVVKVAQSAIMKFSESVEDYYPEWTIHHIFGELKTPKVKSCLDRTQICRVCIEDKALRRKMEEDRKLSNAKGRIITHYPLDDANLSEDSDENLDEEIYFTLEDLKNSGDKIEKLSPKISSYPKSNPCNIHENRREEEPIKKVEIREKLMEMNRLHNTFANEYIKKTVMQFHMAQGGKEKWKKISLK